MQIRIIELLFIVGYCNSIFIEMFGLAFIVSSQAHGFIYRLSRASYGYHMLLKASDPEEYRYQSQ